MYIRTKTSPKTNKASVQIVASYRNTLNHHEGGESDQQGDGYQDRNQGAWIVPRRELKAGHVGGERRDFCEPKRG